MYTTKQINQVSKVLKINKTNYWTGSQCKNFEKEFSKYHNIKYSIAVSNGSVALELALKSLNLKKRDAVIVTPRSFIISASCVLNLGLRPIFADVDLNGNLSIEGIKKSYNKNVKALIVVHLNGLPCDLEPILDFTKKKKIFLIEDCSQAHGAIYKGKKVGSFGHISTWSFCQDKIMSTGGEGGMISTNNKRLWLKIWSLKDHGKNYHKVYYKRHKTVFKWLHDTLGSNFRMTEMQAALGRIQLKSLDSQIKKRNLITKLYLIGLKEYYENYKIIKKPNFKCQSCPLKISSKECDKCRHSYYKLNVFLNNNKIQKKLIRKLNKKNIICGVGSCPEIYRETIFKKLGLYPKKRLINARMLGETSLAILINPYKSLHKIKHEILFIKKTMKKFISNF
jgi:dTDP-4-amino-4,6-dideoxygalactose transaminase